MTHQEPLAVPPVRTNVEHGTLGMMSYVYSSLLHFVSLMGESLELCSFEDLELVFDCVECVLPSCLEFDHETSVV